MADALKMLLAMALFFGAIYLYAIAPDIIEKLKQKRLREKTLIKEEDRKEEVIKLQQKRDGKNEVVGNRREKIRQHFMWLEEMNEKIKRREDARKENIF